ncbi:MAG: hypothetical protein CVU42_04705 [Chloroflexi bacterium HGW-Chloroflexi-4]|jgi:hypothetical protein|nr:MAG: hypothetical protein CVU42_04705 [Chloroflexi bacterium HGW-Chloroflexi-4]
MAKNILNTQQQKDAFDRNANDYKLWFGKARALHFSAKELFKIYQKTLDELMKKSGISEVPISLEISDQVLLLEGFAIECLLKGLYLADGAILAVDGKIKKDSHNLLRWCEKVNIELDNREREIISTLSLVIVSYGRYPVPINNLINPLEKSKEFGYKPRLIWSHNDLVLIDNLIISILGERDT